MRTNSHPVKPGRGLGIVASATYLPLMRARDRVEKAKAVRLLDDDGRIHLTTRRPSGYAGGIAWTAFCGKEASSTFLSGLPHVHDPLKRCKACYAAVDAYGYPRLEGYPPEDIALPVDRDALQTAAVAGVENVREAWDAMKRIRAALEKRGRVGKPKGLDFNAEADALVAAISKLKDERTGK